MKITMALLGMLLGALTAQASEELLSRYQSDETAVTYLSWCQNNIVLAQDSKGEVFELANCSEQNLKCTTSEVYRSVGKVVTASCQKAQ